MGIRGLLDQERGKNGLDQNSYMRAKNDGVFTVVLHYVVLH